MAEFTGTAILFLGWAIAGNIILRYSGFSEILDIWKRWKPLQSLTEEQHLDSSIVRTHIAG